MTRNKTDILPPNKFSRAAASDFIWIKNHKNRQTYKENGFTRVITNTLHLFAEFINGLMSFMIRITYGSLPSNPAVPFALLGESGGNITMNGGVMDANVACYLALLFIATVLFTRVSRRSHGHKGSTYEPPDVNTTAWSLPHGSQRPGSRGDTNEEYENDAALKEWMDNLLLESSFATIRTRRECYPGLPTVATTTASSTATSLLLFNCRQSSRAE